MLKTATLDVDPPAMLEDSTRPFKELIILIFQSCYGSTT
jgi:hypothetical protein